MTKLFRHFGAAAALAFLAIPAAAQDEPEEARTSYQITYVKFAPGADERWLEIMTEHTAPARAAAQLPPTQIHWLANGPWDVILVTEMPDGMAALDTHNPRAGAAYAAALLRREGSEAAVAALNAEMDALVADSDRVFTHTHP